jgi:hypothetical protein
VTDLADLAAAQVVLDRVDRVLRIAQVVHHDLAEGREGFAEAFGHVAQHLQQAACWTSSSWPECIQFWTKNPSCTESPYLDVLSKSRKILQENRAMTRQEPARYIDPRTGRFHDLSERRWRSDDGNPMMVTPLPGITRDDIDARERSVWRYRAALPVVIDKPASMGEGCTPLVQKRWGGIRAVLQARMVQPDLQLQGPRRGRDDFVPAPDWASTRCWKTARVMAARPLLPRARRRASR